MIWAEPTEGGVLLRTFFDAPTEVSGTLKGIDLLKHRELLPHWMEHNDEHAADFVGWADKATLAGHEDAAQMIIRAANAIRQANASLRSALEEFGGPLSGQPHIHSHSR